MLSCRRRAAAGKIGRAAFSACKFKADKETTMKKLWNIFTSALVVLVVLLALLLVGARLVGLQVFTVLSGSMEPTYHTGSLIYVKKVDATKLSEGTVITFMLDEDTIATHRIVGVVPDEEDPSVIRYRTKGDANENEDGGLVHYKNVVGTPVFTIPKLGYFANYIQHPPGTYVAISAGALILLLMFLPELLGMLTGDEKKEQAPAEEKPRKPRRSKKKAAPQPPVRETASRPPVTPIEAQQSGFDIVGASIARPQNEASSPKPSRTQPTRERHSSGSHAAAAPAKRTKRKGGAHCAK